MGAWPYLTVHGISQMLFRPALSELVTLTNHASSILFYLYMRSYKDARTEALLEVKPEAHTHTFSTIIPQFSK